jgi:predicted deacylase
MKEIRSYNKLLEEIINLNTPFRISIIGYITYFEKIYPMIEMKCLSKMARKTVVIQSGQHGDENFAINILLKWIKQPLLFNDINFYIYPCINVFGYATGSRDNGNRQDTNNDAHFIKDSPVPELAILYDAFPQQVDMIIDLHGDTGKDHVYAYEHKSENLTSIVQLALLENDATIPYVRAKTIYKISVTDGVISPPKYDQGIELFMEKLGVTYTVTLELPGKYDGQKRAIGGVAIINSILKHFNEVK